MSRFSFTGKLALDPEKWLTSGKSKAGKDYLSMRGSIIHSKNNRAFIELYGQVENEVKFKDKEKNDATVAWKNRNDESVLKEAMSKYVLALSGNERYEFLSTYDLVDAMREHYDDLKDKMVTVTGRTQKNIYNGKISDRFTIQNVYVVADDARPKFEVQMDIFYNKESIDGTDFKDDKKIYINGYTYDYVDKDNGNKYVAQQVVINASKVNLDDEVQSKKLDGFLSIFKGKRDGLKIASAAKNTDYYKMSIRTAYVQGAEEVEFNEALLTDFQKEQLALGSITLDDCKPKGQTYGERVVAYNVTGFNIREEYADGPINVDKAKDFEENIYVLSAKTETVADLEKNMNPPTDEKKSEDEDWDLFS